MLRLMVAELLYQNYGWRERELGEGWKSLMHEYVRACRPATVHCVLSTMNALAASCIILTIFLMVSFGMISKVNNIHGCMVLLRLDIMCFAKLCIHLTGIPHHWNTWCLHLVTCIIMPDKSWTNSQQITISNQRVIGKESFKMLTFCAHTYN